MNVSECFSLVTHNLIIFSRFYCQIIPIFIDFSAFFGHFFTVLVTFLTIYCACANKKWSASNIWSFKHDLLFTILHTCKEIFIFFYGIKENFSSSWFWKNSKSRCIGNISKSGRIYIFLGVVFYYDTIFFWPKSFLCIFRRRIDWKYQIYHKNSLWPTKMRKTVKNGLFWPFYPFFDGFFDFFKNWLQRFSLNSLYV